MPPRVLILRAPGTNCDGETAHAFERAGGKAEVVHVGRVIESPALLAESQILCIPGGFSYGDDIASGRIFGLQMQHHLGPALQEFKAAGKLILGICNGFQVLANTGLLAENSAAEPAITLAWNASGRFEDRWVRLAVSGNKSVFLSGVKEMYLPVAHGEGRFAARDAQTLGELESRGQLALRYAPLAGTNGTAGAAGILPYPDNPNGAEANVAGMCDASGRVLGLMPHPERHVDPTQHPRWTRGEAAPVGDGLLLFQNAVNFFR